MLYSVKTLLKWSFLFLFAALNGACTSSQQLSSTADSPHPVPAQQPPTASREGNLGLSALIVARNLLGTPYQYGGRGPNGFDCSGLVHYSYSQAGFKVPRTSRNLFRSSKRITPADLQPGDLVFFRISQQKVSHVGIYDSHDRFIHAPSSGKGVSYASLENPYWRERLAGAGRL